MSAVTPSNNGRPSAGSGAATSEPYKPLESFAPAVKYKVLVGPEPAPLPNPIAQRPLSEIGVPFCSNVPTYAPVNGSKALIHPASSLLPIKRSFENSPKFDGAIAIPHGQSS